MKRSTDTDVSVTVTETQDGKEQHHLPPLKLRIKETLNASSHNLVADISNSLRQSDSVTALLKLSDAPISVFSVEDGEQLARVLKESLRKEDNYIVKGRILLVLKDLLKMPNLTRLVSIDDLIEPAHKEGEIKILQS